MKKTLAIILSIFMLFGAMPFVGFAADESAYDRAAVAADDAEYISDMTAEQMASVILDWLDREIAKYSDEMKQAATQAVIQGFEGFEISAFGEAIAEQIPEIASLDDVLAYKSYLTELGGDFANLDATSLVTREQAGSALGFIDGVFQFMADNSDVFGKVFRWDSEVFDYGKVSEYILSLDTSDPDNKKIVDFYNNYLIGNDIQSKFVNWVAGQMNYTPAADETFDDTLNNGILGWFVGLCEANGILSAEGIEELKGYDLRTSDIYTLVKNFVALVQSDNEVKLDTYYNYLLDTVVRSLLKTTLGQKAVVGESVALPSNFNAVYKDLALLESISGGTVYFKDGDAYYQVALADGAVTACNALTWANGIDINFEAPTATIYTGKNTDQLVQVYRPTSKDNIAVNMYASAKNQALMADKGIEFAGEAVPEEYAALMTDANAKALADSFGLTVAQGEDIISTLKLAFADIEEYAEAEALKMAQPMVESTVASLPFGNDTRVESIDIVLSYKGWSTDDEFIAQVTVDSVSIKLSGSMASMIQSTADSYAQQAVGTYIDNPVATVVVDGLSGNLNVDDAKALLDFLDTDFDIDSALIDFAGNYDAYNGVVGQVNRVLYGLVDMLVSDAGMEKLNLTQGNNDNFTANLEKICATANDMMTAAQEVINNEEYQAMLGEIGIDMSAILGTLDLDLLYAVDFSSVENLWVSVIGLGFDMLDDGTNETVTELHAAVEGLKNLDAIAVAVADYAFSKCIPAVNNSFSQQGLNLTVPTLTDAKTVNDGDGKDIIMTKVVDLAYQAAAWGVGFVNATVNDIIATISAEADAELPTVEFKLNVEKKAAWQSTLAALVDRVYGLADGILIACDNEYTDTFDRISAVANSVLPLGSLASNCASEKFAFDFNKVMSFIFDDGFDGDFDGFLRLFETKEKTEDVAAACSVTEALIVASEHIVDSVFPNTVNAEDYVNLASYAEVAFTETTVQEYFTSAENDQLIASQNMDSINARKAELVPAVLNLVREAGVLPFFAKCDQDHTSAELKTVTVPGKAATCTEDGCEATVKCAECGYVVSGGKTITAKGHKWGEWKNSVAAKCESTGKDVRECDNCDAEETRTVAATGHVTWSEWKISAAPTCEGVGYEERTCSCGKTETREVAAKGHNDADGDNLCDDCGFDMSPEEPVDNSFFGKIRAFFQRIIDWFKNLFG